MHAFKIMYTCLHAKQNKVACVDTCNLMQNMHLSKAEFSHTFYTSRGSALEVKGTISKAIIKRGVPEGGRGGGGFLQS